MRGRPAPAFEETGLAVPPRKRDCIGEACPVAKDLGRCFVDEHHDYASEPYYRSLGYPFIALRNDPLAINRIARCRHNSTYPNAWHSRYDITVAPRRDAVYRFLEESRILRRLNLVVADLGKDIEKFFTDDPRVRYEMHAGGYETTLQRIDFNSQILDGCMERAVTEIEVVPSSIVGRVITQVGERRNKLAERALALPELGSILFPMTAPQLDTRVLP